MSRRAYHPVWVHPSATELEGILGDCLSSPVTAVDVTVANETTLADPQLEAHISCWKFPEGHTAEVPFPLMDVADTIKEQTQLGIDAAQVALDALCETCPFRSSVS